jgi:predicted nucleic acid-binding Zn ribbon protein
MADRGGEGDEVKEKPARLGDALQEYLRKSGLDERIEEAAVLPDWEDRVGAAIAAVTAPVRVSHGTMIVAVRTSGWLMELRLMEREILRRLNEGRQLGRIDRIRFVMTGDEDKPADPEPRPRFPRRPRNKG